MTTLADVVTKQAWKLLSDSFLPAFSALWAEDLAPENPNPEYLNRSLAGLYAGVNDYFETLSEVTDGVTLEQMWLLGYAGDLECNPRLGSFINSQSIEPGRTAINLIIKTPETIKPAEAVAIATLVEACGDYDDYTSPELKGVFVGLARTGVALSLKDVPVTQETWEEAHAYLFNGEYCVDNLAELLIENRPQTVGYPGSYVTDIPLPGNIVDMITRLDWKQVSRVVESALSESPGWKALTPEQESAFLVSLATALALEHTL